MNCACFPKENTRFQKKGEIHEFFMSAPFLNWFPGATPDSVQFGSCTGRFEQFQFSVRTVLPGGGCLPVLLYSSDSGSRFRFGSWATLLLEHCSGHSLSSFQTSSCVGAHLRCSGGDRTLSE